jgi:hypothetical protein
MRKTLVITCGLMAAVLAGCITGADGSSRPIPAVEEMLAHLSEVMPWDAIGEGLDRVVRDAIDDALAEAEADGDDVNDPDVRDQIMGSVLDAVNDYMAGVEKRGAPPDG